MVLGAAVVMIGVAAQAQAEDRTLSFKQMHTGETLTVTFKRNGRYDADGLKKINYILRDWRRNESTSMDPALLDLIWEVRRSVGSKGPVHVLSGYRSPVTNATLRSRSGGVAQQSQHMVGKALDFYLPDVPLQRLRETALKYQRGGVGYYPSSGSPFVHLDTGNPRHWPRMTRQQLAKLFPDGKTVMIPSDGKPMPGYNQAVAELSRGGSTRTATVTSSGRRQMVMNYPNLDPSVPITTAAASSSGGRGFLARLFESGEDGDEEGASATRPTAPVPSAQPRQEVPVVVAAVEPAAAAVAPAASASVLADVPLPRLRPAGAVAVAAATPDAAGIPAPPTDVVLAAAAPAQDMPIPMPKPVFTATAQPQAVALAVLPRERPLIGDALDAAAGLAAADADVATGSTTAATALASAGPVGDLAPFAATFTGIDVVPSGRPALVAIDHRPAAMKPYMSSGTCLRDTVFVALRHPDQTDIGGLTTVTAPVVVNHFGDGTAFAMPARRFSGAAVAPVATRSYVLAAYAPVPAPAAVARAAATPARVDSRLY